jgi:hypothetical protein
MPTEVLVGIRDPEAARPQDGQGRDRATLAIDLEVGQLLPCRRQATAVQADDRFSLAGGEVDLEAEGPGDSQQCIGCVC